MVDTLTIQVSDVYVGVLLLLRDVLKTFFKYFLYKLQLVEDIIFFWMDYLSSKALIGGLCQIMECCAETAEYFSVSQCYNLATYAALLQGKRSILGVVTDGFFFNISEKLQGSCHRETGTFTRRMAVAFLYNESWEVCCVCVL